jgi:hypothetical protein
MYLTIQRGAPLDYTAFFSSATSARWDYCQVDSVLDGEDVYFGVYRYPTAGTWNYTVTITQGAEMVANLSTSYNITSQSVRCSILILSASYNEQIKSFVDLLYFVQITGLGADICEAERCGSANHS